MLMQFKELFAISIQGFNLPITVLLVLMLLYWLSVILGALDIDFLSFDLDLDTEGSLDLDGDLEAQAGGSYQGFMLYFNIGTVPVTIWLSVLILVCWSLSMVAAYTINPSVNPLLSLGLAIPNLIIGMYAAKFVCQPLKKVFAAMEGKAITNKSLIGQRALVTSSTINPTFGQIEIKTDGAPITMNARTGSEMEIPKGSSVVITREIEPGTFQVELI